MCPQANQAGVRVVGGVEDHLGRVPFLQAVFHVYVLVRRADAEQGVLGPAVVLVRAVPGFDDVGAERRRHHV